MANPEWTDVYDEIRDERQRQDAKWGGAEHDDGHTVEEFVGFITKHAGRAVETEPHEQRRQMIRVGALAVAVVEKIDRHQKRRAAMSEERRRLMDAASLSGTALCGGSRPDDD